ncbi:MAG: SRPBCC family protein [bacterium]
MTWEREYTVVVPDVTRAEIWNAWRDVNGWHRWDTDIEYARMDGPFEAGQQFTLKPKGGPRVQITFERVEPMVAYTDFTRFPLARMWGIHEMHETERGLELRCCIRVTGPLSFLWRKLVAEGVVNGLEQQTRQLIAYVHERRQHAHAAHP